METHGRQSWKHVRSMLILCLPFRFVLGISGKYCYKGQILLNRLTSTYKIIWLVPSRCRRMHSIQHQTRWLHKTSPVLSTRWSLVLTICYWRSMGQQLHLTPHAGGGGTDRLPSKSHVISAQSVSAQTAKFWIAKSDYVNVKNEFCI